MDGRTNGQTNEWSGQSFVYPQLGTEQKCGENEIYRNVKENTLDEDVILTFDLRHWTVTQFSTILCAKIENNSRSDFTYHANTMRALGDEQWMAST